MSNESKCPQCGAPLPDNAPAGLCPSCLMALNLKTETVFSGDSPAAQPPLPPEQIAPHFPQLEILECLGRGGMGVVYKARQRTLNRFVALKLLAPERVRDAKFAERFTREAQALAALNHPNIVTIYDFGQAGGFYFLLMEFVDGVNLRQLLRTRKFTPEEALTIVPPLCDALQFAHERGIVHRDIKPENLLLDKDGRIKVADFGIAKMLGAGADASFGVPPLGGADRLKPELQTALTADQNVGTPGYSAPEQKSDPQRVDSRADIYSLGVVFYEMLTGELPGKRIEPPSRKVQIDVRLDAVVLRALEKTPELRWQTAADLRTRVETIAATGSAGVALGSTSNEPAGAITFIDLNGMRLRVLIWGFALAAAGISMNLAFGILGVLLFLTSAALSLAFGDNLKTHKIAASLVAIDGIVMASAAIWFAFNTESLKMQWLVTIVAGCFLGIGYCFSCLMKLSTTTMRPSKTMAWPKAKTAIVLGMAVLLVAGIITVAIREFSTPSVEAVFNHHREGRYLKKAPPVVILRPSSEKYSSVTSQDTGRMVARGISLSALMSLAYGSPTMHFHGREDRVILAPGVADGKFDLLLTVPNRPQEALQSEIKKQLGLIARREMRDVDVLVLKVSNPMAVGLTAVNGGNSSGRVTERGGYEFTNEPISFLRDFLEGVLGKPVIDETELTQSYSGGLKLNPPSDPAAKLKEIQNALSDQFGLELVPRRQPVEMLVVEKAQ